MDMGEILFGGRYGNLFQNLLKRERKKGNEEEKAYRNNNTTNLPYLPPPASKGSGVILARDLSRRPDERCHGPFQTTQAGTDRESRPDELREAWLRRHPGGDEESGGSA
jgi:hypothetical protein